MISKEELCKQIRMIYPDIGACGIDVTVDYDSQQQRWTVVLRKDRKELKTFLEPGDAENCMMGRQCLGLSIEINQLKDSIDRMPGGAPAYGRQRTEPTPFCEKAPELAEHYRFQDEDAPCNDGRS